MYIYNKKILNTALLLTSCVKHYIMLLHYYKILRNGHKYEKCTTCDFENVDAATVCINCGEKFEEDNSELELLKRKAQK